MKSSNTPTEHIEQALLFKWATFSSGKYPELEYISALRHAEHEYQRAVTHAF